MIFHQGFWIVQLLNGLQLSMLLFLLSVGLSVIFGLMNFVNLAHGSLYALGAFVGYSIAAWTGSFWLALILAPLAVAGVGAALYHGLIARLRTAGPLDQVLATFGLIFVILDLTRMIWGNYALGVDAPAVLRGSSTILGETYPTYRLFIIALGAALFALLYLLLEHSAFGSMVRAAVDDGETAACMGIDVERTFFVVFSVGCALAGLAGVIAAPVFSVYPGMGISILIPTLVVVVVGGLGSLKGAIAGSLLVGMTLTFGQVLIPQLASIIMYAFLVAVLLLRPQGLFPVRGH